MSAVNTPTAAPNLAPITQQQLGLFVQEAQAAFGSDLVSIVLFGSAAEGRLRATSDINLILVLKTFRAENVNKIREAFRLAHAAIKLEVMFLLQSEVQMAATTFAVKFSDIIGRHRVLFGEDPFAHLSVSREATIYQLKQVIFNQALRLRERYALLSLREEQLALVIAETAGPLRSCAASILNLTGYPAASPKEALEKLVTELPETIKWQLALKNISSAREQKQLPPGEAPTTLLALIELFQVLQTRVDKLN